MPVKATWVIGESVSAAAMNAVAAQVNTNTGAIGFTPEAYGAVGDGTTNDTTAMQNWVTAVTSTPGNYGSLTPGKVYKITAALTISNGTIGAPFKGSWTLDGQGSTIKQATNNTAIIAFTSPGICNFAVRNIVFDYVSQQTSTGGTACITFDTATAGQGWFNACFEKLTFNGACYRGIWGLEAGAHNNIIWGCTFRQIFGFYGMTGSLIRFRPTSGAPNNLFDQCYQQRTFSPEPMLDLWIQHGLRITNLECNDSALGGNDVYLKNCYPARLSNIRTEGGANGSGEGIYKFQWCQGISVTNWEVYDRPYTANAGYVFDCNDSTHLSVGPGHIYAYGTAAPGANLTVVRLADTTCHLTRYEGVVRPAAVVDITAGRTVDAGITPFTDFVANGADTLVSITPGADSTAVQTISATGTTVLDGTRGLIVATGSTATWTLPVVAGNAGKQLWIKNRGSGTLTVQRAGTDQIYSTSAVTSVTVAAGDSMRLLNDGTYWSVL